MRNKGGGASPGRTSVIQRESSGKKLIEQSRVRLFCITAFFFLFYGAITCRLIEVMLMRHHEAEPVQASIPAARTDEQMLEEASAPLKLSRGDIVDRNGVLLATTLSTESLFANPGDLRDPQDAARRLAQIFPEIDAKELAKKLSRDNSFVWIKRNLTPREQRAANNLGIPGLYFQPEQRRIYPHGNLLSHLLGFVGVDQKGLAGVERYFDGRLRDTDQKDPLQLSVDLRVQNIVHEELKEGMHHFGAIGATGIVLDLHSGEVLALSNLPDFDPHQAGTAVEASRFNRASLGVYEMGSTFKTFTTAMALDYGIANMNDSFDATHPIQYAHYTIRDAHPMNKWLTIPEIYAYSSNVGTVRMAMNIGTERQQAFLKKLGLMEPLKIELPAPEVATPHYPEPDDWHEINMMTIAYGHGMSVTPLHLVRAISSIVNGGTLEPMTLVKGGNAEKGKGPRIVSEKTSRQMCRLMRMVVEYGTGKKGDVPGYRVGGKTGTAEKAMGGGYSHNAKLALFVSTFPVDDPKYVILVMIDEPKGTKETAGFATGGWISAPIVSNIISRMAPMYGVRTEYDIPEDAVNRYWVNNANQKFLHAASY